MSGKWLLTVLILAGLVLGAALGQALYDPGYTAEMPEAQHQNAAFLSLFHFVGDTVFMGLLRMLIIPLIATSVVVAMTSIGDVRELGRIGLATVTYYFATMLIAVTLGLILVTTIQPGKAIGEQQRMEGERSYERTVAQTDVAETIEKSAAGGLLGAAQSLVSQLIPSNPVAAAAGGQPLPVIFFSLLFGGAVASLGQRGGTVVRFFDGAFEAMMHLTHLVLWLAPVGVFALLAWTVARIGLGTFTQAIGLFMVTVIAGLAIHGGVVLPLTLLVFGRANPLSYANAMRQALMTAFGTDSSSATLPVTIECAETYGRVSKKAAGFVLPLGSTINMDGTALYEAVAVVFLAQAYNLPLGPAELILIAVTATLAAVGAAGIPSAGLVTMVIVLDAVNHSVLEAAPDLTPIPIAAVGLVLGVDRILDMCRTTVNVWGDAVGAKIVTRLDPGVP
jgi:Na+/H+-dicarboxylate symporter